MSDCEPIVIEIPPFQPSGFCGNDCPLLGENVCCSFCNMRLDFAGIPGADCPGPGRYGLVPEGKYLELLSFQASFREALPEAASQVSPEDIVQLAEDPDGLEEKP